MTDRTIDREEAIEILHNFLPLAVNGEINEDVMELIETTVGDMAAGNEVMVQQGPLLDLVQTFFACFDFDDKAGTYRFQRDNYIAEGQTHA